MNITELLIKYDGLIKLIRNLRKDKKFNTDDIKKLLILSEYKYNSYEHLPRGMKFFENLLLWLKNFKNVDDIEIAIDILNNIIYFSQLEIQYLSEILYREKIRSYLLKKIIVEKKLKPYDYKNAFSFLDDYLKQSLFIAMSDGAMIDYFRRTNRIHNDQIITYYKLHTASQKKILENYKIRFYFLIDDFVGTGTTFLRDDIKENSLFWLNEANLSKNTKDNISNVHQLKGSLIRFLEYWELAKNMNYEIIFCPYIITNFAQERIEKMINFFGKKKLIHNFNNISILPAYSFPDEARVIDNENFKSGLRKWDKDEYNFDGIKNLCEKNYQNFKENKHHEKGGGCKYGFGSRGLAIVKYNNTPNNSIYLLWHNNKWDPLFKRNERHE